MFGFVVYDRNIGNDKCNDEKYWTDDFFLPILRSTMEVPAETVFSTYPKTAREMRRILKVCLDLLLKKEMRFERTIIIAPNKTSD